jgi:uncharacterized protein (UPF0335 family)
VTISNADPGGQIRAFVERIERMDDEIGVLKLDRAEILKEAKGAGFDTKAIKRIVALRKIDPEKRAEAKAVLDIYAHALGMEDVFA